MRCLNCHRGRLRKTCVLYKRTIAAAVHSRGVLKYGHFVNTGRLTTDKRKCLASRICGSLLLALVLVTTSACLSTRFDYPRVASEAISPATDTTLRRQVALWQQNNAGPSGFFPLSSGTDALGARLRLTETAEKSIDVQYFLMKGDTAGQVFTGALLRAADRGVRVRFLLDDIFTTIEDEELELLDAHAKIEVRLHNPISRRGVSAINKVATFRSANRRMHNKSFTVDNQATIVGGRNIADEYFDLRPKSEFLDLDMLAIGPVAHEVSAVFDRFWNHRRSVPMAAFGRKYTREDLAIARAEVTESARQRGEQVYRAAIHTGLIQAMVGGAQSLYSADATVLTDEPEKLTSRVSPDQMLLVQQLLEVIDGATQEVIVMTPYFVPGKAGVAYWKSIVDKGVRVVLVTNSLASNNHTAVHAGYAKYRKRIIEAGVELYEVRALAASGSRMLHTKGMIIDRRTVFIGSLNLDPRSIAINSEMGMLVPNASLAESMAENALQHFQEVAYRVELDDHRRLRWRATIDGVEVVEESEPQASHWHRFKAFLLRIVPENQL